LLYNFSGCGNVDGALELNEGSIAKKGGDAQRFSLIVAHDQNLGIGKGNQLPWRIPQDLKRFRELTSAGQDANLLNAVIMGRKTWDSIPPKQRPLPKRHNIVLTRSNLLLAQKDTWVVSSLEKAVSIAEELLCENLFVIGGAEVYRQAIGLDKFRRLYATEIKGSFDCDVFFPDYSSFFTLSEQSEWMHDQLHTFRFCTYEKN